MLGSSVLARVSPSSLNAARWVLCRHASSIPPMPDCHFEPSPYKGPSYEETITLRKDNLTPALVTYYKKPLLVHQGHMQWMWDHDGKRYLDLFGGIVTVSVGHCHPKVKAALDEQTSLLWHSTNIYMHPRVHEYGKKLVETLPPHLNSVYFVNSGSDANDLAVMMARLHTGRYDVIGLRNAYHGGSPFILGMTAHNTWRYNTAGGFGMQQTMNPDVYRGPWGGARCRDSPVQADRPCDCAAGCCMAEDMYVEQLHDVLRHSTPKAGIAAFFAESIQGVGGTVQYPKGFLKRAFEAVREKGGLCVSDEVQTGFGRTGTHMWGFEGHDVQPDIVTMAKGIGNGFPLAAVVTTKEVASTLASSLHFNTYGGNPMSSAVGSAVLDAIKEDGCQQTSLVVGTYFLEKLAELRDEFEIVGDVRGKGLMIGIEMVTDKKSRTPLPGDKMAAIWEKTKEMGVLYGKGGLYGNTFRVKPPMCITKEDVDFAVAVLREAIANH